MISFGGLKDTVVGFAKNKLRDILDIDDKHDELMKKDPDAWVFGYYHFRAAIVYAKLKEARAGGKDIKELLIDMGVDIPEDNNV